MMQFTKPGRAMRALAQDRVAAQLMGVPVEFYSLIGFALGAMLAGLVGGLLVTITGVNSGIGGPISIKAFMMVMIGGAGVVGGAIAGGFILGMLESVGLTVLHAYGDITYLVDLRRADGLPRHSPERADGQAVGLSDDARAVGTRIAAVAAFLSSCLVVVPWRSRSRSGTDLYYTLSSVALVVDRERGVWLTFYIGRINIGQGAYALIGGYVSAILVDDYGVSFWLSLPLAGLFCAAASVLIGLPILRLARRLFRHGDAGADRGRAAHRARAAGHQRRQGHHQTFRRPARSACSA